MSSWTLEYTISYQNKKKMEFFNEFKYDLYEMLSYFHL